MGLIKAATGAIGGVLADQWKEFFVCEALSADVLVAKGVKRTSDRSSNTDGEDNIISNGSVISVADGQAMIIVEQGKVVDLCAEPGAYTYDKSTEPSLFTGPLGENIINVFKRIGHRFTFGGDTGKDQRIYYFNTKEIPANKYGTASPVPFRIVDARIGLDIDSAISCFGEYSYKIVNPILFYTNVCGNVTGTYLRTQIDSQLKTELLTALQPAFARISAQGIRYSALPAHTTEIADALNEVLSNKWRDLRGIEIVSFGVNSVKASEEDEKMIKELQRNAALKDPSMAAAHLVGAQAAAMQAAAANEGAMGAAMGFMGMGMANQAGANASELFKMAGQTGAVAAPAAPAAGSWTCACGTANTGKFCTSCGLKKPDASWKCACGATNAANFCSECGAKRPAQERWRCDKCGWMPEEGKAPPKFCPECGDPFDDADKI